MRYALVLMLLLLAACGTPEQRCVRKATQDLRTVNDLIAETEANLARGYTTVLEPVPVRFGVSYCTGRWDHARFCGAHEPQYRRRPVAIDGEEERRKLATLKERQQALRAQLGPAVEACGVTIATPEPG